MSDVKHGVRFLTWGSIVALGWTISCRAILGIDEERPLLDGGAGPGGGNQGGGGGQVNSGGANAGGSNNTGGASSSSTEWASWPLTPDGAPTSNYTLTTGTVTDNATGLMWMRTATSIGIDYESAITYCANLTNSGFDDWRLPTRIEIVTLVTFEFDEPFVNNDVFFGFTSSDYFWTSSPYRRGGATGKRWTLSLADGSPRNEEEVNKAQPLCVRKAQ